MLKTTFLSHNADVAVTTNSWISPLKNKIKNKKSSIHLNPMELFILNIVKQQYLLINHVIMTAILFLIAFNFSHKP
jgi:hypothetical protein